MGKASGEVGGDLPLSSGSSQRIGGLITLQREDEALAEGDV